MYRRSYHVLVVDDDSLGLYQTMTVLRQRDYIVVAASGLVQAEEWLARWPIDLLVTAIRITGSGGVRLLAAARAQHPALAGILIGNEGDQALEMDAWRLGASLVIRPFDPAQFLMVVAEKLASIRLRQRWPRKAVAAKVPVRIAGWTATLVDVSYGGLRFALEGESYDLPSPMTIEFPAAHLQVPAELVWSARASDGVSCLCGAAIMNAAPAQEWRRFVDRVPERP